MNSFVSRILESIPQKSQKPMAYKDVYSYFSKIQSPVEHYFFNHLVAPFLYMNINVFKISPNALSILSGISAAVCIYLFYQSNFLYGSIFYAVSYLFDCMDGAAARAMNRTSKLGIVLEVWIDSLRLVGTPFAIAWALYTRAGGSLFLILALIWCVSFAAGLWIFSKSSDVIHANNMEDNPLGHLGRQISSTQYLSYVPMWMDIELIGFFILPLLGYATQGFMTVTLGYPVLSLMLTLLFLKHNTD